MQVKVCFVYPWATLGGVERVLLNRSLAFKQYLPSVRADFCFLHDSGGLGPLKAAIGRYGLEATTSIVRNLERDYDLVFAIDCPQAIEMCVRRSDRYVVECHTAYKENRGYLGQLPAGCERVVTPSVAFSDELQREFPSLQGQLSELRNFVPWDITGCESVADQLFPNWTRRPILFLGRLDRLKDPVALLDAFEALEGRRRGEFMLLFCGPRSAEIDIDKEISRRSLGSHTVVLPAIPFASAGDLFAAVSRAKGVFVSPSKGESFGLSAAEAICSLVPVVLSDIEAHINLVGNYAKDFIYPLGDAGRLSKVIEAVLDDYSVACDGVASARKAFSARSFIQDWTRLFEDLNISL